VSFLLRGVFLAAPEDRQAGLDRVAVLAAVTTLVIGKAG
jgi:hypothetical protein